MMRSAEDIERIAELEAHVEYLVSFFDETERASIETPATSLARLKAKWQSEAVYRAIVICTDIEATEYLAELRRQAEEPI